MLCNWDHMHWDWEKIAMRVHEEGGEGKKEHLLHHRLGLRDLKEERSRFEKEGEAFYRIYDGSFLISHGSSERVREKDTFPVRLHGVRMSCLI